jgi:hypothetical protein
VDTDILKPDTGYLTIIERPSHIASPTGTSSKNSSEHPTSGSRTPNDDEPISPPSYHEPESEGEEDNDRDLAPARDEDKWTRLSGKEVQEAIAYREHMLKARRESDAVGGSGSGNGNGKGKANGSGGRLSARRDAEDEDEDTDAERVLERGRPQAGLGIPTVKSRTLSIDPLAPSSAFDETLRDRLQGEREARKRRGIQPRREEEEEDERRESDDDEDDPLLPRPTDDERRVSRDVHAPPGKRISVPVRIEPKVYFAAERTFLVRHLYLIRTRIRWLPPLRRSH